MDKPMRMSEGGLRPGATVTTVTRQDGITVYRYERWGLVGWGVTPDLAQSFCFLQWWDRRNTGYYPRVW